MKVQGWTASQRSFTKEVYKEELIRSNCSKKTKEDETHLNLFYSVIHYCPDTKTSQRHYKKEQK